MKLSVPLAVFFFSWNTAAVSISDTSKYLDPQYEVKPISLDDFSTDPSVIEELDLVVEQFMFESNKYEETVEAFQSKKKNKAKVEYKPPAEIRVFHLSNREDLDPSRMNYVLSKSPKSVIIFEDSGSVMVPDQDTIVNANDDDLTHRVKQGDKFVYAEFDLSEIQAPAREDLKIPASPCLLFDGTESGAGSVGVNYNQEIQLNIGTQWGIEVATDGNLTVAMNYFTNIKSSTGTKISGSHTCSTSNSVGTRLFYSPITTDFQPLQKAVVYDRGKSTFEVTEWEDMGHRKYVTNRPPKYFCEYGTREELQCDTPASGEHKHNGFVFNSTIVSSIPTRL